MTNIANNRVISIGSNNSKFLVISNTIIKPLKVLVIEEINALIPQIAKTVALVLKYKYYWTNSPNKRPIKHPRTSPGVKIPKGIIAVVKKKIIRNLVRILYKRSIFMLPFIFHHFIVLSSIEWFSMFIRSLIISLNPNRKASFYLENKEMIIVIKIT